MLVRNGFTKLLKESESKSNYDIKMVIRDLNARLRQDETNELLENSLYIWKLTVMDREILRIYKTLIRQVLTYGCETSAIT
jgi:hypothetical protein